MTLSVPYHVAQAADALDGYSRRGAPAVVHLLTDLLFYCCAKRIDFRTSLARARTRFRTLKVNRR